MVSHPPKITRADWCNEAQTALTGAAGSAEDLAAIRADVINDRTTQLYRVSGSSQGWLVLRLEGTPLDQVELVIVLGAGTGARRVIPIVKDYARRIRASVRTHINRPGLQRMYEAEGFYQAEIVMRWRPADGQ